MSAAKSGTATSKPRASSAGAIARHVPVPTSGLCSRTSFTAFPGKSGVHAVEEVRVVLRSSELVEQELDGVGRPHRRQDAAQNVRLRQRALVEQELVLARARLQDVDRGIDTLVGHLAVENDFGVTRPLELFEDDFVHAAAGI